MNAPMLITNIRMAAESRELAALVRELEQLKRQLPRHSIPSTLLVRIEELEEEIAARQAQASPTSEVFGTTSLNA